MNVFEKLQSARCAFQRGNVKKSGYNSYTGFRYFELADILPVINKCAEELGFCCVVSFGREEATLTFIDSAKPEDRIVFASPMSEAHLKNNHAVQNLGAVQTYLRRYLYLCAFEITEGDSLDAVVGKQDAQKAGAVAPIGEDIY